MTSPRDLCFSCYEGVPFKCQLTERQHRHLKEVKTEISRSKADQACSFGRKWASARTARSQATPSPPAAPYGLERAALPALEPGQQVVQPQCQAGNPAATWDPAPV